jgi:hypothetical protein
MLQGYSQLPDFTVQRERFLAAARQAGAKLTQYPHPLKGPKGEALATDVAVLGNPLSSRLFVVVSGTHGVEGYYGSECQIDWLAVNHANTLPADTAVVMIHMLNPWGTAHLRRVNEDNMDLNRNFIDFSKPLPVNARYEDLHDIYLSKDLNGPERAAADDLMDKYSQESGWSEIKKIVEAGQYTHADGIFFGGQQPSWSNRTLLTIIQTHLAHAKAIVSFDLHTGAGAYGHPMLMAIAEKGYPSLQPAREVFGPWLYVLITGKNIGSNTGVTATATGYLSQFMLDNLPDTQLIQLVVECGTYDGETMHHLVRDDHWLHLYGDPQSPQGKKIKGELFEGFYPQDKDWQQLVHLRTQQIFNRAFSALASL